MPGSVKADFITMVVKGFPGVLPPPRLRAVKPIARFVAVVFPAPFGPRKPKISPCSRLIWSYSKGFREKR